MKCKQCQTDVPQTAGKVSRVFCSDKCRMRFNRSQPRTRPTPNNPEQATPNKGKKPTFADLPADVQASIEKMCAENNNGARAASHSRQAMTERALDYQAKMGKRPAPTGKCQTCGGPVQHPAIVKCLKCCTGSPAPAPNEPPVLESAGPLSVYAVDRWARLQMRDYVWDVDKQLAVRPDGVVAVTVPGDPAYYGAVLDGCGAGRRTEVQG